MGRRKQVQCVYCGKPFYPRGTNHHKQTSCRSPACLRAAARKRQSRARAKRKQDTKTEAQFRLAEAERARQYRLRVKARSEAPADALSSLLVNPNGMATLLLGLLSQICDLEDREFLAETAGSLARRGNRFLHQKTPVFRASG